MKKTKLIAVLLLCAVLFSSCGIIIINRGDEKNDSEKEGTSEITYTPPEYPVISDTDYVQDAKAMLDALPDADLNGISVFIVAAKETGEIFNDTEGAYYSAVLQRNAQIEDKYNAKLITEYKSASELYNAVQSASKSEDYYADFAVVQNSDMGKYHGGRYLTNILALPYIDLDQPYYNKQAISQLTIGGVVYGAVGSVTETPEQYACLYFNKTLGAQMGISIDYESVYNGTFTYDKLFTYIDSVTDGYAALTASYDNNALSLLSLMSIGQTYLASEDGTFVSSFVNDSSKLLVSELKKLISQRTNKFSFKQTVTDGNGNEKTETVTLQGFDIFASGKALISYGLLSDMTSISNAGFDWEVLPLPKLSEEDEYYTATTLSAPVITLLATSPNIDTNGYILEALGAASYRNLQYQFVKNAMRDSVTGIYSADMIELILENPMYDLARMFGGYSKKLRNGTYVAFYNAVSGKSSLAYYANKGKSSLQSYLKSLK